MQQEKPLDLEGSPRNEYHISCERRIKKQQRKSQRRRANVSACRVPGERESEKRSNQHEFLFRFEGGINSGFSCDGGLE